MGRHHHFAMAALPFTLFPRTGMKKKSSATDETQNGPLSERVYRYITEGMDTGQLHYGEFLDQDKICEQLEVSKTPLRDALIRLEIEGFIVSYPRKGAYINPLTREFIKSAYQIVGAIEADCIDEVFGKPTAYHIRKFEASNQLQRELLEKGQFVEYYKENINFHNIFLELSENCLLSQILMPLRKRLYNFPLREYSYEWEDMNLKTHQRFIDAVQLGNRQGAVSIFRVEHWSFEVHKKYLKRYYGFD